MALRGCKREKEEEEKGAEEMVQQSRALAANPEDQSLDPSTHDRHLTDACNTSSKGPDALC